MSLGKAVKHAPNACFRTIIDQRPRFQSRDRYVCARFIDVLINATFPCHTRACDSD